MTHLRTRPSIIRRPPLPGTTADGFVSAVGPMTVVLTDRMNVDHLEPIDGKWFLPIWKYPGCLEYAVEWR